MSLTGGHLDAFLAAGLTAEQIVALVKADISEREKADEERRAKDRERQRRHRESRDVTVTNADSRDETLRVSLDKEKSPRPPKEINPFPCVSGARGAGYHRMPDGWRPAKPFPAELQAKVDQWPPGAVDDQIACLKRWAANAPDQVGKGRKKDWDKALWNWLTRVDDERYSRRAAGGIGKSQEAYRLATAGLDPDEAF